MLQNGRCFVQGYAGAAHWRSEAQSITRRERRRAELREGIGGQAAKHRRDVEAAADRQITAQPGFG